MCVGNTDRNEGERVVERKMYNNVKYLMDIYPCFIPNYCQVMIGRYNEMLYNRVRSLQSLRAMFTEQLIKIKWLYTAALFEA